VNGEKERSADSVRCLFCNSINKVLLFSHYLLKFSHVIVLLALELTIQYVTVDMLISDHELCLDASMDQVLTKPIGKKALIAAIHSLASGSDLGNVKLPR
jgi:hypothetical protein